MEIVTFTNVSTIQIVEDGAPTLTAEVTGDASRNIQVNIVDWNQIKLLRCNNNQLQTLPTLPVNLIQLMFVIINYKYYLHFH